MNTREKEVSCEKKNLSLVLYHNFMYISSSISEIRYPKKHVSVGGLSWLILKANIHISRKWFLCISYSNATEQLIILSPLQTNSINDSKL